MFSWRLQADYSRAPRQPGNHRRGKGGTSAKCGGPLPAKFVGSYLGHFQFDRAHRPVRFLATLWGWARCTRCRARIMARNKCEAGSVLPLAARKHRDPCGRGGDPPRASGTEGAEPGGRRTGCGRRGKEGAADRTPHAYPDGQCRLNDSRGQPGCGTEVSNRAS